MDVCEFCGSEFRHPGSLGRHLDRKRGDQLHPAGQVDAIRSAARRRSRTKNAQQQDTRETPETQDTQQPGPGGYLDMTYGALPKKYEVSEKYLKWSREAELKSFHQFDDKLPRPTLGSNPNLARMVVFFLDAEQWPMTSPPGADHVQLVSNHITHQLEFEQLLRQEFDLRIREEDDLSSKLFHDVAVKKIQKCREFLSMLPEVYRRWTQTPDNIKAMLWMEEQAQAARDVLANLSMFTLTNRRDEIGYNHRQFFTNHIRAAKLQGTNSTV